MKVLSIIVYLLTWMKTDLCAAKMNKPLSIWLTGERRFADNWPIETFATVFLEKKCSSSVTSCYWKGPIYRQENPTDRSSYAVIYSESGEKVGATVYSQSVAMSLIGSVHFIVCDFDPQSWTMIPVENLVSASSGTGTKLIVKCHSADAIPGIAFALDTGADGLLLEPSGDDETDSAFCEAAIIARAQRMERLAAGFGVEEATLENIGLTERHQTEIQLCLSRVTDLKFGTVGDRVCLDLIRLLEEGEGLLIGSSAKALAFVHGETISSEFVATRPFRVNAGPVHSYVLMGDGSTKYLCELKPGDVLMVVNGYKDTDNFRKVAIGRLKVELRPMIQISYENSMGALEGSGLGTAGGQIFLQQAETVRVLRGGGNSRPVSVTDISIGDEIITSYSSQGTHLGRRIEATVQEL